MVPVLDRARIQMSCCDVDFVALRSFRVRSLISLVLPVILGFSSSSPDYKMWQQAPLDTVFMLDDVDDMLESWES